MHIAILTGGGDCPGLNAVIRAATLALQGAGARVTGIERGFYGLMRRRMRPIFAQDVDHILDQGGTILGTHNKADPFHDFGRDGADVSGEVVALAQEFGIDGVVAIGGDGTMSIAHKLHLMGLPMIGVPKTIDNDLALTERTFGFDSAVAVVAEAIGRLRTTARSHGRVMIVETMGRYAGWIALEGGLAGGADVILIPELPFDPFDVLQRCRTREGTEGDGSTIICIAEGAAPRGGKMTVARTLSDSPDPIRLGGVGEHLRAMLEPHLKSEVRTTLLGHVQRGGTPTAFDRVLATRFGHAAAQLAMQGRFGEMVALQADECISVPLEQVAGKNRLVPRDHALVKAARNIGVCLGDG
jgi:ATP-dependent phosphofructokinase / diphosphate-dependent phosphofructokinase